MSPSIEIFNLVFSGMTQGFGVWWVSLVGLLIFLFAIVATLSGQDFFSTTIFVLALVFPAIIIGIVNVAVISAASIIFLGIILAWYTWKLISS